MKTTQLFDHIQAAIEQTVDLPESTRREAIRTKLSSLLNGKHVDRAMSYVDDFIDPKNDAENAKLPNERVGRYILDKRLDHGARKNSEVWLGLDEADFDSRVAVKILPKGVGWSLRNHESQILRRLQQENIATYFGNETYKQRHCIVTQYVEGQHIDEYCLGKSDLEVLQLAVALCRAVAFAHKKAVIHADIKPSNVLVDSNGKPVLIDFGVSRILDSPDIERGYTIPYAAPEQMRSDTLVQSDIYSLGVLLFELFCGTHPYGLEGTEEEHEACHLIETKEVEFSRKGNATLSKDIEAVVQKAIQANPMDRYQSADLMLADLVALTDGGYVQARGEKSRSYRAMKTIADPRFYTPATMIVVLASLLFWADLQRKNAIASKKEADSSFRQTRRAVHEYFDVVAADPILRDAPGLQDFRLKLLEQLIDHETEFLKTRGKSNDVKDQAAMAHYHRGTVQYELGRMEDAKQDFSTAIELFNGIDELDQDQQRALAGALEIKGLILGKVGQLEEAKSLSLQAVEMLRPLRGIYPKSLARSLVNYASKLSPEEGLKHLQQAEKLLPSADETNNPELLLLISRVKSNQAAKYMKTRQLDESLAMHINNIEIRRQLFANHRTVPKYRRDLAHTEHRLGVIYLMMKDYDQAMVRLENATNHRRVLHHESPKSIAYAQQYAQSCVEKASCHMGTREYDAASRLLEEGIAIQSALSKEHPEVHELMNDLASTYTHLGSLQTKQKNYSGAVQSNAMTIDIFDELYERTGAVEYLKKSAICQTNYGILSTAIAKSTAQYQHAADELQEAWRKWNEAETSSDLGKGGKAQAKKTKETLNRCLYRLASAHRNDGNLEAAAKQTQARIDVVKAMDDPDPKDFVKAACDLSLMVALAKKDIPTGDNKLPVGDWTALSIAALREAVKAGYTDVELLRTEPDLDAVRGSKKYEEFMSGLEP